MNSELERYIELTTWVRELSTPRISDESTVEEYQEDLLRSFIRIGEISRVNTKILEEHLYPLLEDDRDLTDEELDELYEFCLAMIDATNIESLDMPMIYVQAKKLLAQAEKKNDLKLILRSLDLIVMSSYVLLTSTLRLYPSYDYAFTYRDVGLEAAKRILEYLPPEKFQTLPDDTCKEIVLINSRYISSLFIWDDEERAEERAALDIKMMKDALALADDPFYREQAPNYDWNYHIYRTLQYITCFTEFHNGYRFNHEQLLEITDYTKQFIDFLNTELPHMETDCSKEAQELYLRRNEALSGQITKEDYLASLRKLFEKRKKDNYAAWTMNTYFLVPFEYLLNVDADNLTEEDITLLSTFYKEVIRYIYHMPKMGVLTFMLTYLAEILKNFVVVPGGPSFETFCLNLMAALHQTTYVHTLGVADFTVCLTKHLLNKKPEAFIGILDTKDVEEVKERKDEILDHAYNSALLHDVGKIFIMEVIITYERRLFDLEREIIRTHPVVGASLLDMYDEVRKYSPSALGHHKFYNNIAGYPESFDLDNSQDKTIIHLLTVADCLDAATDKVGRNYKRGKTLEQYVEELKDGKGTRYAPDVVDLFNDPEVSKDIEEVLQNARDNNYRKTFTLLKSL